MNKPKASEQSAVIGRKTR